jgi:5,6-dimethylbenzimidazole synthase
MHWRRDVRRFKKDKIVDEEILHRALSSSFHSAPSVGLSEPWRIIRLDSEYSRKAALDNFQEMNAKALDGYNGSRKKQQYASLKLSGMKEAPIQLAIYCDDSTSKGSGLGAQSMTEMRRYSVVSAITLFWLAARCVGLGCGWVSILDPIRLTHDLNLPDDWTLVGYLCVGYPEEDNDTPELERANWEKRTSVDDMNITSV